MLDVNLRRVQQPVVMGIIPRADHRRYVPAKCLLAHHRYLQKRDRERGPEYCRRIGKLDGRPLKQKRAT